MPTNQNTLTDDLPLVLTTGRIRDQWHTMSKTGKVSKLKTTHCTIVSGDTSSMMQQHEGLGEDDLVEIINRQGHSAGKSQTYQQI